MSGGRCRQRQADKPQFSHQTSHSLGGSGKALGPQLSVDTWTSLHLPTPKGSYLNALGQLAVFTHVLTRDRIVYW